MMKAAIWSSQKRATWKIEAWDHTTNTCQLFLFTLTSILLPVGEHFQMSLSRFHVSAWLISFFLMASFSPYSPLSLPFPISAHLSINQSGTSLSTHKKLSPKPILFLPPPSPPVLQHLLVCVCHCWPLAATCQVLLSVSHRDPKSLTLTHRSACDRRLSLSRPPRPGKANKSALWLQTPITMLYRLSIKCLTKGQILQLKWPGLHVQGISTDLRSSLRRADFMTHERWRWHSTKHGWSQSCAFFFSLHKSS